MKTPNDYQKLIQIEQQKLTMAEDAKGKNKITDRIKVLKAQMALARTKQSVK
jgi:hypothetical protein